MNFISLPTAAISFQDDTGKPFAHRPELGIDITPDLATGPTNIYFDNGFHIGPSENGPTRLRRKHLLLDGCGYVDARKTQLEVRRWILALSGESGLRLLLEWRV